jgi:hypothetical protein
MYEEKARLVQKSFSKTRPLNGAMKVAPVLAKEIDWRQCFIIGCRKNKEPTAFFSS